MDAFFASVAELQDPSLKGKPVVIAEDGTRTVVSAANYEARKFGLHSAMPLVAAKRKCPHVTIVSHDRAAYERYSRQIMGILREFTPLVEPLSVDEAFLDVRGATKLWGSPVEIATAIRARILAETGLVASVGIASTKFVAKVASAQCKPDGLLVVPPDKVEAFLHPLPIRALWGVGPTTAEKLESYGLETIGDVARSAKSALVAYVGEGVGTTLWNLANAIDPREVQPGRTEQSVSKEATFREDVRDRDTLSRVLLSQSEDIAEKLRHKGFTARTIAIKLRRPDFTTVSRSVTLPDPTNVAKRVYETALGLLDGVWQEPQPVRLLGVRTENLQTGGDTQALWDPDEEWREIERTKDDVQQRFGRGSLGPASLLGGHSRDTLEAPRESGETD